METRETIHRLERLTHRAMSISQNTRSRKVARWEEMIASVAFARLSLNGISVLRLSPGSLFCPPVNGIQILDIPSIASLSRNLVEAYLTLRYMLEPMGSISEETLREKVWQYHEVSERYKMLQAALPNHAMLNSLRGHKAELRSGIQLNSSFQSMGKQLKRRILNGDTARLRTNEELCYKAGVGQGYYSSMFKYGSNHTHSSPYSLAVLNGGSLANQESQSVFRISLHMSAGFIALGIRDFVRVFPDQLSEINEDERNLLTDLEDVLKWKIDSSPTQTETGQGAAKAH